MAEFAARYPNPSTTQQYESKLSSLFIFATMRSYIDPIENGVIRRAAQVLD
jgi:hypothetical protein